MLAKVTKRVCFPHPNSSDRLNTKYIIISNMQASIQQYGDKRLKKEWEGLRERVKERKVKGGLESEVFA